MAYRLTLSEAESCLRKAARARGLDWGIAEEAGKAARWLAAFGLPGPELMFGHLQNPALRDYHQVVPNCEVTPWQAGGGVLCPVITGAALADRSAALLAGNPIGLGRTAYPLLLSAALSQAAAFHRTAFAARWSGVRIVCFADGMTIAGERGSLLQSEVSQVRCWREDPERPQLLPSTLAYEIDEDTFRQIDELASRICVPASDQSRAGAGAGLDDND